MQNQTTALMTPPVVKLKELKNLFFELNKNCNLKCQYCYIKNDNKNK